MDHTYIASSSSRRLCRSLRKNKTTSSLPSVLLPSISSVFPSHDAHHHHLHHPHPCLPWQHLRLKPNWPFHHPIYHLDLVGWAATLLWYILVIRNKWNTYLDLLQANCSEGVFSIQRRALYVAQLIKIDHQKNTACIRQVEQLIKDEAVYAAYELLECFCDFILVQLSYIRKTKVVQMIFMKQYDITI
ncbi:hypothetical protein F8388_000712 [Cannabis sativa]|uniref:Uncharacterized protein n=1 Tax=Cannabis sativa TaxID=3483 RepID=A0A7J6ECU2_CANSA|nr:hypothetical protein F8388_000712 [Cannabis sativa]